MWKSLNVEYKAAVSHFTLSGTHLSKLYEICSGEHDMCYLRKYLEYKPNLVSTVVADLPEEVFMERIEAVGKTLDNQLIKQAKACKW